MALDRLRWNAKCSIYQSIYVPPLTCGHKLCNRKNEIADTSGLNEFPPKAGLTQPEDLGHPDGARSRASCVVRSQFWSGCLLGVFWGFLGTFNSEKTRCRPRTGWVDPEHISSGGAGEGHLEHSTEPAATVTQSQMSGWKWIDGWIWGYSPKDGFS